MGEIHEVFVLALSLVWFAGATPDSSGNPREQGLLRKSTPTGNRQKSGLF